jgi:hypothetical protein
MRRWRLEILSPAADGDTLRERWSMPTAANTAQKAVGTGYADGDRRHSIVGTVLIGDCPVTVGTDRPSAQIVVPTVKRSA